MRFLFQFLLTGAFGCWLSWSTLGAQILVLHVNPEEFGAAQFSCVQEVDDMEPIVACSVSDMPALGIEPNSCLDNLEDYRLVMVQGVYSSFTQPFMDRLFDYIRLGGSVFFGVDPVFSNNPDLPDFQEANINTLLAAINRAPITLETTTVLHDNLVPTLGGGLAGPDCHLGEIKYATGGLLSGPALDYAVTLSIPEGVYQAYWLTGFGGILGVATEFYSAGNTNCETTNPGAGELVWCMMGLEVPLPPEEVVLDCSRELILNSSFEDYTDCPSDQAGINLALPWQHPSPAPIIGGQSFPSTGDLFSSCSNSGNQFFSVPENLFGDQAAANGSAYVGLFLHTIAEPGEVAAKEYLMGQLAEPLIAGQVYEFSMQFSLADRSGLAVDRIGAYFGAEAPTTYEPSSMQLAVTPQITTPAGIYWQNAAAWASLSGTYTATGGEQWVVIGCFHSDEGIDRAAGDFQTMAYYYFDQVSLKEATQVPTLDTTNLQISGACGLQGGSITGLALENVPPSVTYHWTDMNGDTVANNLDLLDAPIGDYRLLVGGQSCVLEVDLRVPDGRDQVILQTAADTVCFGTATDLTAIGFGPYLWSDGSNQTDLEVSPVGSQTYWVQAGLGACASFDTVEVFGLPQVQILIDPPMATLCPGSSLTLTASGEAGTISWDDGSLGESITVSPTGNSTFTATLDNGRCSAQASASVSVLPGPSVGTALEVPALCTEVAGVFDLNTLLSTADPGGSWTAVSDNAVGSAAFNPASGTFDTRQQIPGIYRFSYSLTSTNGCPDPNVEVSLELEELNLNALAEVAECANNCSGEIWVLAPPADWLYSLDGRNFAADFSFFDLCSGPYRLQARAPNGCEAAVDLVVPATDPPQLELGPSRSIRLGESLRLQAQTIAPDPQLSWSPTVNCLDSSCLEVELLPLANTLYEVILTDARNCQTSAQLQLEVDLESPVYVPTAFSPNLDGVNDYFTVFAGPAVVQIKQLYIFDRWGGILYAEENLTPGRLNQGWDGNSRGRPMPTGTYGYQIKVELINGQNKTLAGAVNLMR
ncbi:MAG: gliding motility-associated C-terminal domain-containing protein [Bacteroidota bacterium]